VIAVVLDCFTDTYTDKHFVIWPILPHWFANALVPGMISVRPPPPAALLSEGVGTRSSAGACCCSSPGPAAAPRQQRLCGALLVAPRHALAQASCAESRKGGRWCNLPQSTCHAGPSRGAAQLAGSLAAGQRGRRGGAVACSSRRTPRR